jgi:hypothetical protein
MRYGVRFIILAVLAGIPASFSGCREDRPTAPPMPRDAADTDSPEKQRFLVQREGRWGYIDRQGRIAVAIQYDRAKPFRQGLAAVQRDGRWGFIDPAGDFVIPPSFEAVAGEGFSSGLAGVMIDGLWAAIDTGGRTVIPARYQHPLEFHDGLAVLRRDEAYGFLDARGRVVVEPTYTLARPFSDSLAAVMSGGERVGRRIRQGQWGFVNAEGKVVIEPQYAAVGSFREGLAFAWKAEEGGSPRFLGYLDRTGRVVITPEEFASGRDFSEGLAPAKENNGDRWGFIDRSGEWAVDPRFAWVKPFREGLAAVLVKSPGGQARWGYLDRGGRMAIAAQFDEASFFRNGLARVRVGGEEAWIDVDGKYVWTAKP